MDRHPVAPSTTIAPNRPLRLESAAGSRVTVLHGKVWITQDQDTRDCLLAEGDDFLLDRSGLAVVTALEDDAQVAITPADAMKAPAPASLWTRFVNARRAQIDRARLRAMHDRELQDIGLCRSQIELVGR